MPTLQVEPEIGKLQPEGQNWPAAYFVSKVLWELSHTHLLRYCPRWLLHYRIQELQETQCPTKPKMSTLYRKTLPMPE